jgi:hypothetical protein
MNNPVIFPRRFSEYRCAGITLITQAINGTNIKKNMKVD